MYFSIVWILWPWNQASLYTSIHPTTHPSTHPSKTYLQKGSGVRPRDSKEQFCLCSWEGGWKGTYCTDIYEALLHFAWSSLVRLGQSGAESQTGAEGKVLLSILRNFWLQPSSFKSACKYKTVLRCFPQYLKLFLQINTQKCNLRITW